MPGIEQQETGLDMVNRHFEINTVSEPGEALVPAVAGGPSGKGRPWRPLGPWTHGADAARGTRAPGIGCPTTGTSASAPGRIHDGRARPWLAWMVLCAVLPALAAAPAAGDTGTGQSAAAPGRQAATTQAATAQVAPSTQAAAVQATPTTQATIAQVAPATQAATVQVAPSTQAATAQVAPNTQAATAQVAPNTQAATTLPAPSTQAVTTLPAPSTRAVTTLPAPSTRAADTGTAQATAGRPAIHAMLASDIPAAGTDIAPVAPGQPIAPETLAPRLEPAVTGMLVRVPGGEPIKPIPDEAELDPERVALGRALFHDPRLSKDNTTACVSCHDLGSGGDDGRKVSVGVEGRTGPINSPTVFNVALNFKQFWDGRAETLEQQIDGPVQAPAELGSLWPEVLAKLHQHESYPGRFKAIYPDGINRDNVKNALATFMRSLLTPNSRFDQWLKGDDDALSDLEKRGYALFKHYGCVSCHQGANVGGNMFQVFGVLNEYFKKRGNITEADFGRYNVTGNPADRHAFKVPSLRMAALTAPYLHDGSAETLRDAVDAMFEFQLGREAPDVDKDAIVAFIRTLPGDNRELSP